eukprot:COSAG06_NODE_1941_length_8015_cov_2.703007_15_plen_30_part_01
MKHMHKHRVIQVDTSNEQIKTQSELLTDAF